MLDVRLFAYGAQAPSAPLVGSNTNLYVLTPSGILQLADKVPTRLAQFPPGWVPVSLLVLQQGSAVVILSSATQTVLSFFGADLQPTHNLSLVAMQTFAGNATLIAASPTVLYATVGTFMYCISNAQIAWSSSLYTAVPVSSLVVSTDGSLALAAAGPTLIALSSSGLIFWNYLATAPITGLLTSAKLAVITTSAGTYAINLNSGLVVWSQSLSLGCSASPALTANCSIICIRAEAQGAHLVSLSLQSGQQQWAVPSLNATGLIVDESGTALVQQVGPAGVTIAAIDGAAGKPLWSVTLPGTGAALALVAPRVLVAVVYSTQGSNVYFIGE
jgi:hypothetical protein